MLVDLDALGIRSYISEPDRGRRNWTTRSPRRATRCMRNRRRIRGRAGKRLLRRRGERLERPFAHLYETGGMRRTHLRGHDEHPEAAAHARRRLQSRAADAAAVGVGTPRGLQGRVAALIATVWALLTSAARAVVASSRRRAAGRPTFSALNLLFRKRGLYAGC